MTATKRPCSVTGCDKPHRAKGLCVVHYNYTWRKTNKDAPRREPVRRCDFPDCGRPHYCKGYCTAHYQQHRRGYELTPVGSNASRAGTRQRVPRKPRQSVLPKGWNRPARPQERRAIDISMQREVPIVTPTDPELMRGALATLTRLGCEDLAPALGITEGDIAEMAERWSEWRGAAA